MSGWLDDTSGKGHVATAAQINLGEAPVFSTGVKKFGSSSAYFNKYGGNGSGGMITIPTSNDFDLSGTWSISFWAYMQRTQAIYYGLWSNMAGDNDGMRMFLYDQDGGGVSEHQTTAGRASVNMRPFGPVNNTWTHIALSRNQSAGWARGWVDGVQRYTSALTGAWSGTSYNSVNQFVIGAMRSSGSAPFNGYIDAFHIEDGISNWSDPFTPPVAAPVATAYSVLLMNFNETFYKVQGTLSSDARVVVTDEDSRTIEYDGVESAGAYSIDVDDNSTKTVTAVRESDGKTLGYGRVVPISV